MTLHLPSNRWNKVALRKLVTINYGKSPKEILAPDGPYPVVGTGGTERYGSSFLYDGDSIVLGRKGTIDRVYFATGKFWTIDTAYFLTNFNDNLPRWLFYFLQTIDLRQLNEATGVPSLSRDTLYQIEIDTPPKPEQLKIAEILSTVDRAIEQTEALIAKQQHIKTGLIQDLLTRGIDSQHNLRSEETHQFKDSQLGRIPVQWEVVKVKSVAKIVTGNRDTQDRDDFAEYPFFVRSQQIERIGTYSFDGEAVLTAGDGVGTGKVFHYINGKFDFHQRVYCLHSFDPGMDGYFFFHYFQANFMDRVVQFSAKGSVDSVRKAMIADMLIPKPSLPEQQDSVAILREVETILSDYASRAEKLKSLKIALMQDLLSGKVPVTLLLTKAEASA